jgi:hypothetical protein
MATVKTEMTDVDLLENQRVVYEIRSALFGLIKWQVEIKRETIGKDLIIETLEPYDRIILNGKVLDYQPDQLK